MGRAEASATSVRIPNTREGDQGIVEVQPSGMRGISLVSLTASEVAESDLANLREMSPEVAGSRFEEPPAPSAGPKSKGGSSGLVGEERVTSEVVVRI